MLNSNNSKDKFERFLIRAYNISDTSNMKQLSIALGVPYDLFRKKDINVFPYEKVEALADSKNVNIKWLMSGKGEKYKNQKEIDSNIHKFFELFGHLGEMLSNFQKEVSKAVDPDSDGGTAITKDESKSLKLVAESLANKFVEVARLAKIRITFKIELIED